MSIAQNPLVGQMSGTVGNFVTLKNGDQNVIRSKAFNPRDAKTESQKMQRAGLKLIVKEYQSLRAITDLGFTDHVINHSRYNLFVAANLPNAIDITGEVPRIDYSKLKIASGSLRKVLVTGAIINVSGIEVSYQTNVLIPNVSATDEVVAIAKTKIGKVLVAKQSRGSEAIGSILIPYQNIKEADVVCCYLFILSADRKKSTNSVYVSFRSQSI